LVVAAVSCGPDDHTLRWTFGFDSDADAARAIAVEGRVLAGGCDGTEVLFSSEARMGTPSTQPPSLPPGRYGFAGRARDGDCTWFAEGCVEVELPTDDGASVDVVLTSGPTEAQCAPDECVDGMCTTIDAGPPPDAGGPDSGPPDDAAPVDDAGPVDTGPPDAGPVDAGCPGGCGLCERCVGGACVSSIVRSMAMGSEFACAVLTTGSLHCWGRNNTGQMGNGMSGPGTDVTAPARVGTDADWSFVGAGENHVCATKASGSLWCWGDNNDGQLGLGVPGQRAVPTRTGTDTGWTFVDGADDGDTSCGLRGTALYCWGQNDDGQVGIGTSGPDVTTPASVVGNWRAVAVGYHHTCGIRTDGSLWCWGGNLFGQVGMDTMGAFVNAPARVGTDSDWTAVGTGQDHSCGIRGGGQLFCWGDNDNGALGLGVAAGVRLTPQRVGTATTWETVEGGLDDTCGVWSDGSLHCWGDNSDGQLGSSTGGLDVLSPMRVGTATGYDDIDLGVDCACHLRGGTVYCAGSNTFGQLGQGDTTRRMVLTAVCI
jgi:hypothetical protein